MVPISGVQKRVIAWTPEGVPVPVDVPALTRAGIEELPRTALSLPYLVPPLVLPLDPGKDATRAQRAQYDAECERLEYEHSSEMEFLGMTNAVVMVIKQARAAAKGDPGATRDMLDRVLGKPKQSVESTSVVLSYEDVLREKARRAAASPSQSPQSVQSSEEPPVDAEVVINNPPLKSKDDEGLEGLV